MTATRPPEFISRPPQPYTKIKYWKRVEYRNFLLYYGAGVEGAHQRGAAGPLHAPLRWHRHFSRPLHHPPAASARSRKVERLCTAVRRAVHCAVHVLIVQKALTGGRLQGTNKQTGNWFYFSPSLLCERQGVEHKVEREEKTSKKKKRDQSMKERGNQWTNRRKRRERDYCISSREKSSERVISVELALSQILLKKNKKSLNSKKEEKEIYLIEATPTS